jgi:hypothetical protein
MFRHLRNLRGFFSDYYLGSVFGRSSGRGRGKSLVDRSTLTAYSKFQRLRAYAEPRAKDLSATRELFVRPLLRDVLGFHLGAGEDRVHALFADAEREAAGDVPLALAYCGSWDEDLDAGRGQAQPMHRLAMELATRGLRYGILATGERLRLIRAFGEGPQRACLELDLAGLSDVEDPESFAAALRLFASACFTADKDQRAPIEEIEQESRRHAEQVSEDLKSAVFEAAASLAEELLRDAEARGVLVTRLELSSTDVERTRDAALLALYRLLFIFYAESRDVRLQEHAIYRNSYSAEGLLEQLCADPERLWSENRCSLWERVRALFRIYDEGLPEITPWRSIPPRGSDFFSRSHPAGRLLDEARICDRAVAALLLALATGSPRNGVGRERISFRELDIEKLGAVYEGILEFEPRIARETSFQLLVKGRSLVLFDRELTQLCTEQGLVLAGDPELLRGTSAEKLHPESAPDDDDGDPDEEPEEGDDASDADEESEGEDAEISGPALRKGAVLRVLNRLEAGSFHFVPGSGRKGSGSFYTPRALTADVVRHALEPLVAGKNAAEIEQLRVLDPACGSAHFLVEAMRFLGRELHRAYVEEYGSAAPPHFERRGEIDWDSDANATDAEARLANSMARAWCKRRIAERCLFGVDLNPTAVQLARVSLWIESVAGDRPLSFFEHHVRPGNSLLGTWRARLDRAPLPHLATRGEGEGSGLFEHFLHQAIEQAARLRRRIDTLDPRALLEEGIEPESLEELRLKERLQLEARRHLDAATLLFDLRSASAFVPAIWREWQQLAVLAGDHAGLLSHAKAQPWWEEFEAVRRSESFFHWELEFPEVFLDSSRRGFDAILGNPPWDKVLPTKLEFYARRDVLIGLLKGDAADRRIRELHRLHPELQQGFARYREQTKTRAQVLRQSGDFPHSQAKSGAAHEDLSKYFLDRATKLAAPLGGMVGLIVPSVVYNGDGCVGLRRYLVEQAAIQRFYAFENRLKIFPIDSRYKFVSLVFRLGAKSAGFEAAFMRHDVDELEAPGEKPWMVQLDAEEIRRYSPETYAFLEYRGPRDQEIVRRMYVGGITLDSEDSNAWGTRLMSWRVHEAIFNATEDKDLFTNPATGRLHHPREILGTIPQDTEALFAAMRARGYWPVFEGKHIDQFVVGIKPVRWWLSVAQAKAKYGKEPRSEATLVFRETASNTNERTCIAAILPAQSVGSHKLTGVLCEQIEPEAAMCVLNSLCFDWALRLRTAGTNVSFTYLKPMPVPSAAQARALPRIPNFVSWTMGVKHVTERAELWSSIWDSQRAVARAYGLGPADLAHMLASFPGFAKKRPRFVEFLRARIDEWAQAAPSQSMAISIGVAKPPSGSA